MLPRRPALVLLLSLATVAAHAQDLATTCHATSSYDLTIAPDHLLFDRPQPAPRQVELRDGSLRTDGAAVSLRPDEQDRLALFERELRALAPRVKAVAANGVDATKFREIWNSPETKAKIDAAKKTLVSYDVTGVPSFVVDGKYLTSARMAGGTKQLIDVVDFLVDRARAERPKP